jgi:hypothetical protein
MIIAVGSMLAAQIVDRHFFSRSSHHTRDIRPDGGHYPTIWAHSRAPFLIPHGCENLVLIGKFWSKPGFERVFRNSVFGSETGFFSWNARNWVFDDGNPPRTCQEPDRNWPRTEPEPELFSVPVLDMGS